MDIEPHLGNLEDEYRRHHLAKDRTSLVYAAILWFLFTLYFIRADYLLFGLNPPFQSLVIGKILYCLGILSILVSVHRLTEPRVLDWITFTWSVVSATFIFWCELSRPRPYVGHYTLDVLIIVSLYLVPNRFVFRLTPALFFSLLCLTGLLFHKIDVTPLDTNAIVTSLLLANILGFTSSTRLYTYRREQFRAVIEERRAKEALAVLAFTDPLTGVLNRRALSERGMEEFRQFSRYQHLFSVQVIDLDFFKQVNDTYGHEAGDETLRQFAKLVSHHKRETDIFGRLGGEEFGLILPNTSATSAITLGERLREATQAASIDLGKKQIAITLSMGVAEIQPEDVDFEMLLQRADRLLYEAKRKGRNRVESEKYEGMQAVS